MRYEYLDEITSDQKFRAYGRDIPEVFVNAAMAMFGIMYDLEEVKTEEAIEVEARGATEDRLLYHWLSNLLIEFEVEEVFFADFTIDTFNHEEPESLRILGTARGSRSLPQLWTQIKGVTFHQFSLEKKGDQYVATVVVDI